MLKPITKAFSDRSTMNKFSFVFFCDCCGKPIFTTDYEYISPFPGGIFATDAEKKAEAIIYGKEHADAYERANVEVLHELNRCESCCDMICEECSVYDPQGDGRIQCRKCSTNKSDSSG